MPDAGAYKQMTFDIIGSGYSVGNPVSTHIQGYHYTPIGTFLHCKQQNISGDLAACKFMIVDNKIALWIPTLGAYTSLIVQCYQTSGVQEPIQLTYEYYSSEPSGSNKTGCSWQHSPPVPFSSTNSVNANDYTYFGQYYLGSGCSNVPTDSSTWNQLLVLGNGSKSSGDVAQLAIGVSSQKMFMRVRNGSNWSNWKAVSHKNAITVNATANQAISSTAWTQVKFNNTFASQGSAFSLSNNRVTIGAGITKVKVSCNVWINTVVGYSWVALVKNSTMVAHSILPMNTTAAYRTHSIASFVLNVSPGDTIWAEVQLSATNSSTILAGANYSNCVNLTVEEV